MDERVQTRRDTVRNTEVDVEDIEKSNLHKSSSNLNSDDVVDSDKKKNNF